MNLIPVFSKQLNSNITLTLRFFDQFLHVGFIEGELNCDIDGVDYRGYFEITTETI